MTLKEYKEQYKTAIEARNFHYQNFSTWTAYFSVIVGALFVAFYNVDDNAFSVLVAFIGFVVSLCWHWSNKGYTYWWHHWTMFLDDMENNMSKAYQNDKNPSEIDIEKELYGRVHSVFYDVKSSFLCPVMPANISTSKVALLMSFVISTAWCYLMVSNCDCLNVVQCSFANPIIKLFISVAITWILVAFGGQFFQSNLCGHYIIKEQKLYKYIKNGNCKKEEGKRGKECGLNSGVCIYNWMYSCEKQEENNQK